MILYHFTDELHWPYIQQYGISRGDVPITPTGGFNAPWFTVDPDWHTQGWIRGTGKNAIRITVQIPDDDQKLKWWPDVASHYNVEKSWYDALDESGGGGSDNWYIYEGVVPVDWFVDVERR